MHIRCGKDHENTWLLSRGNPKSKKIPKVLAAGGTVKPRCRFFWFALRIGGEISLESWQSQATLLDLICFPSDRKIFTFISKLTNWIQKFVDAWGKCSMIIATPPTVKKPKNLFSTWKATVWCYWRQEFCFSSVLVGLCDSHTESSKSWGIYINV